MASSKKKTKKARKKKAQKRADTLENIRLWFKAAGQFFVSLALPALAVYLAVLAFFVVAAIQIAGVMAYGTGFSPDMDFFTLPMMLAFPYVGMAFGTGEVHLGFTFIATASGKLWRMFFPMFDPVNGTVATAVRQFNPKNPQGLSGMMGALGIAFLSIFWSEGSNVLKTLTGKLSDEEKAQGVPAFRRKAILISYVSDAFGLGALFYHIATLWMQLFKIDFAIIFSQSVIATLLMIAIAIAVVADLPVLFGQHFPDWKKQYDVFTGQWYIMRGVFFLFGGLGAFVTVAGCAGTVMNGYEWMFDENISAEVAEADQATKKPKTTSTTLDAIKARQRARRARE